MKVGIVTQSYYPRYGGVTEHVHHVAAELQDRGHAVTVITGQPGGHDAVAAAYGVERVGRNLLVPFNRAFVDLTVGFGLRRRVRHLLAAGDFDVLHLHNPLAPTLPLIALEEATCPRIGTFHGTLGRSLIQDAFQRPLAARAARLDARIAVSRSAEAASRLYFPGQYEVIPNGVDLERFRPDHAPFGEWRDPSRVNLLFVGRLDPRKGLPYLLSAMPQVVDHTQGRARLLIVGDSYLRPRFAASVPPALRTHVHFLGHVPRADLPRWYATGDIFVSPASGNESFGIVLLEAMASGVPVVATDLPGYRAVIDPGENAEAFPPGDVASLARTLCRLIDDSGRRATLARRGRARAMEFAWPRVVDRIEAVYRGTLQRRTRVTSAA